MDKNITVEFKDKEAITAYNCIKFCAEYISNSHDRNLLIKHKEDMGFIFRCLEKIAEKIDESNGITKSDAFAESLKIDDKIVD